MPEVFLILLGVLLAQLIMWADRAITRRVKERKKNHGLG